MRLAPLSQGTRRTAGWIDSIPTGLYCGPMASHAAHRAVGSGSRQKLLDAAIALIPKKGYAATSVDDLCAMAGVTKGAFFHHFKSKSALAVAATHRWTEISTALFGAAPYHAFSDPLDRVLGYLDFRKALLVRTPTALSCLAGTMVQEVYASHPDIARACEACILGQAATLEGNIAAAMKRYRIRGQWTPASLALHTQAVLQGAFILAKAKGGADVAVENIDHLRRYFELLFKKERRTRGKDKRT